jgi:Xaa-Pro aminopeptidase
MSALSVPARLRQVMAANNIAAYVVPTADAHQSEYVSDADKRREYLTSFSGSAGVAVLLAEPFTAQVDEHHGSPAVCGRLFTDGRYFLQADQQLAASEFQLMKGGVAEVPKQEDWLLHVLPQGANVAIDPRITSISAYKALKSTFKQQLNVVFTENNLVDEVWGSQRPKYSSNPLLILEDARTGESSASKIQRIRAKMADAKASLLVVAALDEVAWLFNLRGGDIPFNPVFMSYALITLDTVTFYIDTAKITPEVKAHLGDQVATKPYDAIWTELKAHAAHSNLSATNRIWLDPSRCNTAIYTIFQAEHVLEQDNPIQLMKAVKNDTEIGGMRLAHLKDAAAMVNFLSWLEIELLEKGNTDLTECSVADRLEAFRAEQADFVGLSFDTISGSGSNGAIIHYKPEPETCKKVTTKDMFLLDSGAQYKDGTTDITRTVHFGQPTEFEKESFTRVLKGHIMLGDAVFPPNTVGPTLDAFARQALWQVGLDYVHGTGHGVGHFLNVHEGPCGISSSGRSHSALNTGLQSGMILSNEPGYYQDGQFGIRIESLVVVRPRATPYKFLDRTYLGFETITLVPIQRQLIQVELLTDAELAWLNAYHAKTRNKVQDRVQGRAKEWLLRETEPIVRK